MKYYIVSAEQLHLLERLAEDYGKFVYCVSNMIEVSPFYNDEYARKKEELRRIEIPEELDMIVGYSTPNPNEIEIWHRDESGQLK